jgi:hypothetical protein
VLILKDLTVGLGPLACSYYLSLMKIPNYMAMMFAVALIVACFLPWVVIESKNITITGVDSTGTNFGKPGYLHFAMAFFFIVFVLTPRVWAKRANLFITALNIGWAVKNFLIIPACEAGECPVKKIGLFLSLGASVLMLVAALFPDMAPRASRDPL